MQLEQHCGTWTETVDDRKYSILLFQFDQTSHLDNDNGSEVEGFDL